MSARFYPRFVKGNPQLRIFLPDWKLIMVKPPERFPKDAVMFKTDIRMTDWDVRNYLEKIYKVPVTAVKSKIMHGTIKGTTKGLTKENDYKLVHVTLPAGQTFKWPDLFPAEVAGKEKEDMDKALAEINKDRTHKPDNSGLPAWFA